MKIAIPTNGKTMDSGICPSFGRTEFFVIYDTETKTETAMDNSAAAGLGGAGIKTAQNIADLKVHALITPRLGENAAEVLKAAGIAIYRSQSENVLENIEAMLSGKLPLLSQIHKGFHHHGG